MKTSFISEINLTAPQTTHKPLSYNEQKKSRENSKDGHMNPLKMKTSFLRQSLSLNTSEQALALNLNNPSNTQRNITPIQTKNNIMSDRRQDFMMRKIVERFSNNASPKNMLHIDHTQHFINDPQKDREIIKLSGRKNDNLGISQIKKPTTQEKENLQKSLNRSFANQSGKFLKNEPQVTFNLEKNQATESHESTVQSVVLDNSLAEYANSLNSSMLQGDQVSVIREQLQLILKRLAKNQCDIESLKRDKSLDVHMEGVWKQLSLCEGKFEMIEKKCMKTDDKLGKFMQEIQDVKGQVMKIEQGKSSLGNQLMSLENKILTDLYEVQKKIPTFAQQQEESQRVNEGIKKIKSEMEGMLQVMNVQLETKIETKLNQMKWELKSQKSSEGQQMSPGKSSGRSGSNKFMLSSKKAHESIALVYKELLKVTKGNLSSSSVGQQSSVYNVNSDRKKLIESVLNQSYTRRTMESSAPVTPERTSTTPYFRSGNEESGQPQIEINQDGEGYLLDQSQYYILDEKGQQIRLDWNMIELLKKQGLLKC